MTPETARAILKIDFPTDVRDRMNALAAKARQGALTPDEEQELDSYNRAGHLLAQLQSKARHYLKGSPDS